MNASASRPRGIFVTGTDTGVGKTRITAALIEAMRRQGIRAGGMKPVAAGGFFRNGVFINDDAELIAAVSGGIADISLVNPCGYPVAASPHIAAKEAGKSIDLGLIAVKSAELAQIFDYLVVEGAGGWLAPLDESRTMADLAARLGLPVLLVVGLRLGCLSHAALTAEAIGRRGIRLAGWAVSELEARMEWRDQNLAQLERQFGCAPLAVLPHAAARDGDARHLDAAARALTAT